ncbi:MAG: TonB-dependent receptor [Candidatus Eremiobacteraeota bacterium]|nr:TonB-dependent receptor [Candidatus Eremiobacteraeota bacterium]
MSLRHTIANAGGDLIAGGDFFRESALFDFGPGALPAHIDGRLAQSALYAQYSALLAHGERLIGGLRGENDGGFGQVLVPSIGTVISAGAARIAANYGGAFRVPTLVDLYYPGFSNPSLRPERTRNLDVTLAFPAILGGISAGFFDRRGSNLIVLDANFVPHNAQRATVRGAQLTAQTRPFRGLVADASVTDLFRATDDVTGARLPQRPVTRATLGLTRPFGATPIAFGLRALVVGSSYDNGTVLPITGILDAYTDLDAYVRYRIFTDAILTLRALNAGNERAAPVYGYPMPGRRVELELSTR